MFNVGDKIKCINNEGSHHFLTIGKEYEVKEIKFETFVVIVDNSGTEMPFSSNRFILVD